MSRHRAGDGVRAVWQEGTRDALAAVRLDPAWVRDLVVRALAEDLGPDWSDVTTSVTVPLDDDRPARLVAGADGVAAGLLLLPVVLAEAAARLDLPVPVVESLVPEGSRVAAGAVLARLRGCTRVVLVAERTALNLIRHTAGVATRAAEWVEALQGTGAALLGTRLTTPGLRPLERFAVRCGGGANGPSGLYDAAHVTVDHVAVAGSVDAALDAVRRRLPDAPVQVDAATPEAAVAAVLAGARFVVCRQMPPDILAAAVPAIRGAVSEHVSIAVSGVRRVQTAQDYGRTGVDHLYVESLVEAAGALDVRLLLL